jgi:hypothetical protein
MKSEESAMRFKLLSDQDNKELLKLVNWDIEISKQRQLRFEEEKGSSSKDVDDVIS